MSKQNIVLLDSMDTRGQCLELDASQSTVIAATIDDGGGGGTVAVVVVVVTIVELLTTVNHIFNHVTNFDIELANKETLNEVVVFTLLLLQLL